MTIHARTRDRLEDLLWMAETGECSWGAAARLGVTENALEKWLDRHDRALWMRLLDNGRRRAA